MTGKSALAAGVSMLAAAALLAPAVAHAQSGVTIGVLRCEVEGGWGFVLGSSKDVHCTFVGNDGRVDRYVGAISKFGLDIGYTDGGVIVWNVIAPSNDPNPGALAGTYGGATAAIALGPGVGANVLIGGFERSFALQPVSVATNTGVNLAAGIGVLDIRPAPG